MVIRNAMEKDLPEILKIYSHYVNTTAYSFEYIPPTQEEFLARFRRITAQFPYFVCEENGEVIGYAYADKPFERAAYAWCAEPSVYLRPDARGKGIGRVLYEALELALTRQGYYVLYAIITTSNTASIAFHRALGYRHLADFPNCGFKLGAWQGITWRSEEHTSELQSR